MSHNVQSSLPNGNQDLIHLFCRGQFFKKRLDYYASSPHSKKIADFLNQKIKHTKDLPFTYRILNHWEEKKLIDSERPDDKGWRRFSIMDQVWLLVIQNLRDFGMPLEKIQPIKSLFTQPIDQTYSFPLMEYYVMCALALLEPVFLIVSQNGDALPLTYEEYKPALKWVSLSHHLQININELLKQILPGEKLDPHFDVDIALTPEEIDVLLMLRNQEFEMISIKQQKGKVELIEGTKSVPVKKQLGKMLQEQKYSEINIQQKEGHIVAIKQTIKVKPTR